MDISNGMGALYSKPSTPGLDLSLGLFVSIQTIHLVFSIT